MSYTFNAPDPDLDKEVDFDFFESEGGRESPTNLGNSGKWKRGFSSDSASNTRSGDRMKDNEPSQNSHVKGDSKAVDNQSDSSDDDSSTGSYSSDFSSDSSPTSRQIRVKKIEAKIPRVDSDRQNDSDGENTQRGDTKSDRKMEGHISRPKTSLRKGNRRSRSYSSASDRSHSSTASDSTTDSDVTDVSPLHSPRQSANRRSQKDGKPPVSPQHKEVTFRRPPSSTSSRVSSKRSLTRANSDDIDLKLLMQAVMEMEQNYNPKLMSSGSARHRPIFSIPTENPTSMNRKNFSFSNEDVRSIDHENQRLMQQIMRYATKNKKKKSAQKSKPQGSPNRMSSSAINRNREQMRIERENFALLQRLNAAKATRDLARERLIKDYQSQMLFGCSVSAAHPVEKKKRSPYTVSFSPKFTSASELSELPQCGKRTRPASAVVHGSRPMSGKVHAHVRPISATAARSRPLSATNRNKRPLSAKVVGTFTKETSPGQPSRPAWEDKW